MFRSKKTAVLVAGAVAALALGSFAFAAIPDGGGVIHACYSTSTGAVRVTDTATNVPKGCSSKETALDWNQQGPKGDRGPSNAYAADGGATLTPNTSTIVATRTIPPGTYAVSGKVVLKASGANVPLTSDAASAPARTTAQVPTTRTAPSGRTEVATTSRPRFRSRTTTPRAGSQTAAP